MKSQLRSRRQIESLITSEKYLMRQSSKGEGTKIAQAAKDLNVTSVTIRRYIAEFNIETTADENGIKVLPPDSMEELHEIRKLKEEGLTNPKVLEMLEERRNNPSERPARAKDKPDAKKSAKRISDAPRKDSRKPKSQDDDEDEAAEEEEEEEEEQGEGDEEAAKVTEPSVQTSEEPVGELAGEGRTKHTLTCQTCGKNFEHMNPRLRDCLDCYRAKRKERRRGGGDRQRNVIQHPLAQQVANKAQQREREDREPAVVAENGAQPAAKPRSSVISVAPPPQRPQQQGVRNYRKAIEETRQITSNLKRRLERPDLPEGERRWLEQIYAYQLILHQGWRHLAEYKAGSQGQKSD
jgi:DNA-binding transcriptional MerR regulator